MYNVSDEFKTAAKSTTRQVVGYITIGDNTYDDEIVSINISVESVDDKIIGQAVCKGADIELLVSKANFISNFNPDDEVIVYLGLQLTNSIEYVPQGKFLVKNYTYDEDKGILKLSCVDYMAETDKHTVSEITGLTYPITIDEYVDAICAVCGFDKSEKAYLGSDFELSKAPNFNGSESLREALRGIAEMCLANVYMNKSGELEIGCIVDSTAQPITADEYFTASFGEKIVPINTVSLVRDPANDIIYAKDQDMIDAYGVSDLIITNNPFMDYEREVFAPDLLAKIKGLSFYPGEISWRGNPAFECFEKLTVTTVDNNNFATYLFSENLTYNGGLKSKITNKCSNKKVVEYAKGSTIKERVKNTEISVDKVNQRIEAVIENSYTKEQIDYALQSGMEITENNIKIYVDEKNELNSHIYTTAPEKYAKNDIFVYDRDYITSQEHDFQVGQYLIAKNNQNSSLYMRFYCNNGEPIQFANGEYLEFPNIIFSDWGKKDNYQTDKDVSASITVASNAIIQECRDGALSASTKFSADKGLEIFNGDLSIYDKPESDNSKKKVFGVDKNTGNLQLSGDVLDENGNVYCGKSQGLLSTFVFSTNGFNWLGIECISESLSYNYVNNGLIFDIPNNFIVTSAKISTLFIPMNYDYTSYSTGSTHKGWGYPRNVKCYISNNYKNLYAGTFGFSVVPPQFNYNSNYRDISLQMFGTSAFTQTINQNWDESSVVTEFSTEKISTDIKSELCNGKNIILFKVSSLPSPTTDPDIAYLTQLQQSGYLSFNVQITGYQKIGGN